MKIAVCSDLHLEFGTIDLTNDDGADVLVLSGDILVAKDLTQYSEILQGSRSNKFHEFFQRCSERFHNVVYIAGNHEHYHGDFQETYKILKEHLEYLDNVHVLDNEVVEIQDVTFVGGTLWTDLNKRDALTLWHIKSCMNDFRVIKNGTMKNRVPLYKRDSTGSYVVDELNRKVQEGTKFKDLPKVFTPEDSVEAHETFRAYIRLVTEDQSKKFVVVGHHAPSNLSIHDMYKHDTLMNGAYYSDLSELMLDRPNIKLWTHGHVHNSFDYMIGETRVLCNPRGYVGHEQRAKEFKLITVEI